MYNDPWINNGTRNSRHQILDKRFRNMDSEMGIRWILRCKNKDKCQKKLMTMINMEGNGKGQ
jgi:hypothetical protein